MPSNFTSKNVDKVNLRRSTYVRRHDVDWLRVIAFAILVWFHTSVLFLPRGVPEILNSDSSPLLGLVVAFFHQFRLALLFLVSGMGVRFALRHRSREEFFRERTFRLLIPLIFGVLVVVPPMIYFEKLYNGQFAGTFIDFYPRFFIDGAYPEGNLSWHHYWFIAYLFLFCIFAWPLFHYWRTKGAQKLTSLVDWIKVGGRLYWIVVLLIIVEIPLRPIFPGFPNLVSDWANFLHWLIIFISGYVFAHHVALIDRCNKLRLISLSIGACSSFILFSIFYDFGKYSFILDREFSMTNAFKFILYTVIRMIAIWAWILTCIGFASRYLNKPSRLLTYLNGAVYPLFCLHLTTIVILAYFILPLEVGIASKLFLISTLTFLIIFLLYELIIRRFRWIGIFVGTKS